MSRRKAEKKRKTRGETLLHMARRLAPSDAWVLGVAFEPGTGSKCTASEYICTRNSVSTSAISSVGAIRCVDPGLSTRRSVAQQGAFSFVSLHFSAHFREVILFVNLSNNLIFHSTHIDTLICGVLSVDSKEKFLH